MGRLAEFHLNQKRSMGRLLGDAFKSIKMHFGNILYAYFIWVAPIFVVGVVFYVFLFPNIIQNGFVPIVDGSMMSAQIGLGVVTFFIFWILSISMMFSIVYQLNLLQEKNPDDPILFSELKKNVFKGFPNVLSSVFIIVIILIILVSLVLIHIAFFVLLIISLFFIGGPLLIFPYVRLRENLGVFAGLKRSFELIENERIETFFVLVLSYFITNMCAAVFAIPLYIFLFIGALSAVSSSSVSQSPFWISLTFLISIAGTIFCQSYLWQTMVLKYYDLVERRDNTGLLDKIGSIGKKKESSFDNEGEF